MPLWVLVLLLFVLIKIVIASLMFWLPYRADTAMSAVGDERSDTGTGTDDEGGSKVPPGAPTDPHPRLPLPNRPRRGPHGSPSPSPPRVRPPRRVVARSPAQR